MEKSDCINIIVGTNDVKTVRITEIAYIHHQKNYTYFYMSDGGHYAQYVALAKVEEDDEVKLTVSANYINQATDFLNAWKRNTFLLKS